jgi:hypothetical protein
VGQTHQSLRVPVQVLVGIPKAEAKADPSPCQVKHRRKDNTPSLEARSSIFHQIIPQIQQHSVLNSSDKTLPSMATWVSYRYAPVQPSHTSPLVLSTVGYCRPAKPGITLFLPRLQQSYSNLVLIIPTSYDYRH